MPLFKIKLPETYDRRLQAELIRLGYSVSQPGRLADAILRLSDHYLQNPEAPSPFEQGWAQAAYLAYYFPLNYARAKAAALTGAFLGFFDGLDGFIDFGSGPGSAAFALLETGAFPKGALAFDRSTESLDLQRRLAGDDFAGRLRTVSSLPAIGPAAGGQNSNQLACFSYALTESTDLPRWAKNCEALFLVEPSTRDDGRKLQRLRAELLAKEGFHAWAPCTHQAACPLLEESERDWCHARTFFDQPDWWSKLEARLPMKNRTITYSYLLARRTPPPLVLHGAARTVGDPLKEKGKTRIALCRGPSREFLAWFPPRMKHIPDLERGELVRIPLDLEIKGAQAHSREIRVTSIDQILPVRI